MANAHGLCMVSEPDTGGCDRRPLWSAFVDAHHKHIWNKWRGKTKKNKEGGGLKTTIKKQEKRRGDTKEDMPKGD